MEDYKIRIPSHKTKIVCTIGPACRSVATLQQMIKAGMNVARVNFSHGTFPEHIEIIRNIRKAASLAGEIVNILADLPGAKVRIGKITQEPLLLKKGQEITFTTKNIASTDSLIPIEYKHLAQSVSKGNIIYLNDGFIQLRVKKIKHKDVICSVIMGGELFSRKGMNLPGAKVFLDPITEKDFEMMAFGLKQGINTFGLSFIEKAADIVRFREFARKKGKEVYLVAKIERRETIDNFDEILEAADGIMVARGDMGVEIPIEEVPVIQKKLISKANLMGRPVITATQMLMSMTKNVRPTRAEVNDVANAILDGTDAVMLSEETAVGKYPLETVQMISKIATVTEGQNQAGVSSLNVARRKDVTGASKPAIFDVIAINAATAAEQLKARYIITSTASGNTVRRIARFKPSCWILSFTTHKSICQFLLLSYGVVPFWVEKKTQTHSQAICKCIRKFRLAQKGDTVIMTERRLSDRSGETDSLGIVTLE